MELLLILVILMALTFDYINGFHDTANAIATSVSTRALSPRAAVWYSATMNFTGAMMFTGVAKTIGTDVVQAAAVSQTALVAALAGAIVWNLLTWYFGIPSSSSHALIGGLVGAVIAAAGVEHLKVAGILKIFAALVVSPVASMLVGSAVMIGLMWLFGWRAPSLMNRRFRALQMLSAGLMSFSHGANDAQKAMGMITMALLAAGFIDSFAVPFWVKLACATAMGLGTATGGWRIIKTMGSKIFKLQPISGFAADLNSSLVIMSATLLHLPASTTHVVTGSILGVGAANRVRAVRWGVAQNLVWAWVLTIPCTAVVAGICYQILAAL
ncbi:MAG: inorganic phosphate transporter [Negativicutes bacterium]|nr:inorganic phosphate transporter [Negativicutes bacterium]